MQIWPRIIRVGVAAVEQDELSETLLCASVLRLQHPLGAVTECAELYINGIARLCDFELFRDERGVVAHTRDRTRGEDEARDGLRRGTRCDFITGVPVQREVPLLQRRLQRLVGT